MYDVIIVGAGPAGGFAAKTLSKDGFRVLLLEKKKFPRFKPCGGWITKKVIQYLGWNVNNLNDIIIEPIKSGVLWFKDDDNLYHPYTTEFRTPVSYGILRIEFDSKIVNEAISSGTDFIDNSEIKKINVYKDKIVVQNQHGREYKARLIIGADGTYSQVAKQTGIRSHWKQDELTLCCVSETKIGRTKGKELTEFFGSPELFFNFNTKGYSWFYTKGDYLNIGTGMRMSLHSSNYNLKRQYMDFLDVLHQIKHYNNLKLSPIKGHSYAVFYGPYNYKTFRRRVFLVGDAAGFATNLTGEGIRPAIISAKLAAQTIKEILKTYDKEIILKKIFRKYEIRWKKELGIEYTFGSIAQSFYTPKLFPIFKNLIKFDDYFRKLFFKMCFNIGDTEKTIREMLLRAPALALKLASSGFRSLINSLLGKL